MARLPDRPAYRKFLAEHLLALLGVKETGTYAVMEEIKRDAPLPGRQASGLIWLKRFPGQRRQSGQVLTEEIPMTRLILAALLLVSASSLSFAQSAGHDHQHSQEDAPADQPSTPPQGRPGMGGSGMGGGMMKNMGGKMPMMDMMQTMGMMRQAGGGMGMATIDRVEGRIAFLRTELKITDAQNTSWNTFADALRANAKSLGEVRSAIMSAMSGPVQQSLVERFALEEKWLDARLEGTRTIKVALVNLIGALSDEQKKAAEELLSPHIGMMAMMQPGQMGSGAAQPGR